MHFCLQRQEVFKALGTNPVSEIGKELKVEWRVINITIEYPSQPRRNGYGIREVSKNAKSCKWAYVWSFHSITGQSLDLLESSYILNRILTAVDRDWASWLRRFGFALPWNPAFQRMFLCSWFRLKLLAKSWDAIRTSVRRKRTAQDMKGYIPSCSFFCPVGGSLTDLEGIPPFEPLSSRMPEEFVPFRFLAVRVLLPWIVRVRQFFCRDLTQCTNKVNNCISI